MPSQLILLCPLPRNDFMSVFGFFSNKYTNLSIFPLKWTCSGSCLLAVIWSDYLSDHHITPRWSCGVEATAKCPQKSCAHAHMNTSQQDLVLNHANCTVPTGLSLRQCPADLSIAHLVPLDPLMHRLRSMLNYLVPLQRGPGTWGNDGS